MNLRLSNRSNLRLVRLIITYGVALSFCLWSAWQLRFDFSVPSTSRYAIGISIIWIVPMKLFILSLASQYSGLLSYFGVRDLTRLFIGMTSSSFIVGLLWWGITDKGSKLKPI